MTAIRDPRDDSADLETVMASSSPQGFTLALRDKMLATELTLPAAARRPAERSVNEYILDQLGER